MKNWFSECRNTLKLGVLGQVLACLLSASAVLGTAAVPASAQTAGVQNVSLYVNHVPYPGQAILYEDTTYVELGEFTAEVRVCSASIDAAGKTAAYTGEGITMHVTDGTPYMEANGRYLWCENGVFVREGKAYVPLRAAAKALGAEIEWNADEFAAYVATGTAPILAGEQFYIEDEVLWLSRIIHAEAGAEPFLGQLAVGNVVLNRVRSELFPDTVYSVIFDTENGVQFTPTVNGTIYCTPDEEAVIAAKLCLEGASVVEDCLYFFAPSLSKGTWITQNRAYFTTIGCHRFYR